MSEPMDANGDPVHQLHQLQSHEKDELLSAIDRLRRQHIDTKIDIPQIVVCGDQSSGKSSVLEAIANVPFPIGASTTTRFAIEVILRQGNTTVPKVTLCPSPDRTTEQAREITSFQPNVRISEPSDFGNAIGNIVDEAKIHLESIDSDAKFWSDWLRVEVSGPDQPHLTLVDLPGIIQTETGPNVIPGDKDKIKKMVTKYIEKERTIVLAIVDAQNDPDNQEVLDLVHRIPGATNRTLGVITKPDKPGHDSDLEKNVVSLANNERTQLGLGWHVLKNLPHEKTDRRFAQRNALEREFFERGAWLEVPRNNVGIHNLSKKLGDHLFGCIAVGLPALITQMRRKLVLCESTLSRLGAGRDSIRDQKAYLHDVLSNLQRLIKEALEGDYQDSEFENFFDVAGNIRLRDRIHNDCEAFASKMRESGCRYNIYQEGVDGAKRRKNAKFSNAPHGHVPKFGSSTSTDSATTSEDQVQSMNIAFPDYCRALAVYMKDNRGKCLPTMQSQRTIQAIFRHQSMPWKRIAEDFGSECCSLTYGFLEMAVMHVAGPHTGKALMREYVHEKLGHRRKEVEETIDALLWPYRESHPMTYDPKYSAKVRMRNKQNSDAASDVKFSVGSERTSDDRPKSWVEYAMKKMVIVSEDQIDAADALDQTETYYDIALDTFIENVPSLAIEMKLLRGLSSIIPAKEVVGMDDAKVTMIASEPAEAKEERAKAEAQKKALDEAIEICQRYVTRGIAFRLPTSSAFPPLQERGPFSFPAPSNHESGSSNLFSFGHKAATSGGDKQPSQPVPVTGLFGSLGKTSSSFGGNSGGPMFGKSHRAQSFTKTAGTGGLSTYQPILEASVTGNGLIQSLTAQEDFRDSSFEVSAPQA